jgi:hypothetical protein
MTPTQLAIVERSRRFHAEIARKARPDRPIEIPKVKPRPMHLIEEQPTPPPEPAITDEMIADWVERQRKRFWFSIEDDFASPLPKIELIQKIVCRHFNIVLKDMLSARRTADVVYPRQIAMFLCKEFTKRSLPEIGRRFGGRDHTTALHAVRVIGEREQKIESLAADLKALREQIRKEHP